jgi:hypothetical protein
VYAVGIRLKCRERLGCPHRNTAQVGFDPSLFSSWEFEWPNSCLMRHHAGYHTRFLFSWLMVGQCHKIKLYRYMPVPVIKLLFHIWYCKACYHSIQNLLSPLLVSKNVKIRMYKTIIFPVVLYRCETWSLTLKEEHSLRVSENMVLRIPGPKKNEVIGKVKR